MVRIWWASRAGSFCFVGIRRNELASGARCLRGAFSFVVGRRNPERVWRAVFANTFLDFGIDVESGLRAGGLGAGAGFEAVAVLGFVGVGWTGRAGSGGGLAVGADGGAGWADRLGVGAGFEAVAVLVFVGVVWTGRARSGGGLGVCADLLAYSTCSLRGAGG